MMLAEELYSLGARTAMVSHVTGLRGQSLALAAKSAGATRHYGVMPQLPSLLRTRPVRIEAGAFLALYVAAKTTPDDTLDIQAIMTAFRRHRDRGGHLSINDGWVLARAYKIRDVAVCQCRSCQSVFLALEEKTQTRCPFCWQLQGVTSLRANRVRTCATCRVQVRCNGARKRTSDASPPPTQTGAPLA